MEIARGTCEHSENALLEPSYALVGSGATLKEVVSKNIIAQLWNRKSVATVLRSDFSIRSGSLKLIFL